MAELFPTRNFSIPKKADGILSISINQVVVYSREGISSVKVC